MCFCFVLFCFCSSFLCLGADPGGVILETAEPSLNSKLAVVIDAFPLHSDKRLRELGETGFNENKKRKRNPIAKCRLMKDYDLTSFKITIVLSQTLKKSYRSTTWNSLNSGSGVLVGETIPRSPSPRSVSATRSMRQHSTISSMVAPRHHTPNRSWPCNST